MSNKLVLPIATGITEFIVLFSWFLISYDMSKGEQVFLGVFVTVSFLLGALIMEKSIEEDEMYESVRLPRSSTNKEWLGNVMLVTSWELLIVLLIVCL